MTTPAEQTDLEVSVVIPCLNESLTIADCIHRALDAMAQHGIRGEVVGPAPGSSPARSAATARRSRGGSATPAAAT
jgi:hypothetical protein